MTNVTSLPDATTAGTQSPIGNRPEHLRRGQPQSAVGAGIAVALRAGTVAMISALSMSSTGGAPRNARSSAAWQGSRRHPFLTLSYEILVQPERLPRGNDFVVGYGGANDYGFNSVVVEADHARRLVVVLTNAHRNRAERVARRIEPLVFP
jgi:hypothetical protein